MYINIISKLIAKAGIMLSDTTNCIVYLTVLTATCLVLMWIVDRVTVRRKEGARS